MWISDCGNPVSMCDGSDSDCWQMECGYITCVGECVHEGRNGHLYNPPPLSLVSQWLSTGTTSPSTRTFVSCGVRKRDGANRLAYCRLIPRNTLHPFFADLSILRPRVKGRSFRHGGAVVMREALSCHLCFLHLLAGFAVSLTTTHLFESIK